LQLATCRPSDGNQRRHIQRAKPEHHTGPGRACARERLQHRCHAFHEVCEHAQHPTQVGARTASRSGAFIRR
jgi:hypothetical protein